MMDVRIIKFTALTRRIFITAWFIFSFFTAGCSSQTELLRNQQPIPPVTLRAAPAPQSGSIWPGENVKNMLFTDNKARYVNDIVTVVVNETSEGNSKASTNTSRDSTTTAGIAALIGLEKSSAERNSNLVGDDLKPKIGIGGSSSNSLKGKGDTVRGSKLTTRLTARVVKVLENGNLVIEGRRQLTMNAEDQHIILSGVIRPEDITSENLIASQYISDAQIYFTGEGVINDKMRPGWLTRVVDWVWPF
jgi:flagellar L-ring protein precursor FlgH